MRKARLFSHDPKGIIPRMSWSPHNLYNLIARSTVPYHAAQLSFTRTTLTMYQQRWRSKRFLRGYHGDWIPERRFKRWFLPTDLPQVASASPPALSGGGARGAGGIATAAAAAAAARREASSEERLPVASLFLRDVERRIDVVVFRCCFASSAYDARRLVVHGKVRLNGLKVTDPNILLSPGDLVSVEPSSVPMLSEVAAKRAASRKAEELAPGGANASAPPDTASAAEAEEDGAGKEGGEQAGQGDGDGAEVAAKEGGKEQADVGSDGAEGSKESSSSASASASPSGKPQGGKAKEKSKAKEEEAASAQLPEGVLPFHLPPFAAPFLFVPPYLEPSFSTCSAIYLRHPTIVPSRRSGAQQQQPSSSSSSSSQQQLAYHTDLPTPYPAGSELFSLAWEHYARNAPRTRGDARRLRNEARAGAQGLATARARDAWRKRQAIRRGWAKVGGGSSSTAAAVGGAAGSGAELRRQGLGDGGSLRVESDRRRGGRAGAGARSSASRRQSRL